MSTIVEEPPTRLDPPAPPARHGGRILKRALASIGIVLLVLMLSLVLLPASVWKKVITHVASADLGRQVSIDGNLETHLFSWNPRIVVEGLRIANADWAPQRPMLTVRRLDVTVSLVSLLKSPMVFPRIEIDGPDVDLLRDSASRANWDFSTPGANKPQKQGATKPASVPVIKQFILADGVLAANDRVRKLKFNGQVAVDENAASGETALRVHGSGTLNGKPFELRLNGGPLINTDHSKPYDFDATVIAADIKLTAHTNIAHPFDMGEVSSKFHLTGKDLADAYYLTGLALPNTPPYDLAGTAVRDGMKFSIDDFRGRLGGSDINGKVGVDTAPKRPRLTATLNSKLLDLADLAAPLGTQATPDKKSDTLANGPGQAQGSAAKQAAAQAQAPGPDASKSALLLPDADLQVGRVRAMDADVQFQADSIKTAKLPINKVQFHLLLDDGKLSFDPLAFTLPEGQFSGSVGLNARAAVPVTDVDMKLQNLDLNQFKPSSSNTPPLAGELVGRIKLHGAGSSVHKAAADADGDITIVMPKGQMRAAFAELLGINVERGLGLLLSKKDENTTIRCGVISFHATDGNLKAATMVVDTNRTLITGSGGVNLKDENLDLSLKGQEKNISLVRIRSPVQIHGTLLHPEFGLKTANVVGQAGAAVALGTLLTPLAALLAFVDPGLAKDANCADLVSQAEQSKGLPTPK
jgi:AsmA family protein